MYLIICQHPSSYIWTNCTYRSKVHVLNITRPVGCGQTLLGDEVMKITSVDIPGARPAWAIKRRRAQVIGDKRWFKGVN
jgi:hypothetical protein